MEKPKYEQLRGLSPTIAIEQKSASSNPRSTVGTVTEIYDYLRVLYARAGEQRCHLCGGEVTARSAAEIVDELLTLPPKTRATLLARKAENRKGEFREVFEEARKAGFARVRINGLIQRLEDVTALDKKKKHTIEIVIDRVSIDAGERARLTDSVEAAVKVGGGSVMVAVEGEARERAYSEARACPDCGVGLPELSPQSFSFNSPLGMCVDCNGLGSSLEIDPDLIVPNPDLSIGDGAIEPWGDRAGTRPGLDRERRGRGVARVRHPARQAVEEPDAAAARDDPVRRRREAREGHLDRQARRRIVGDALRGRRQHDQEAPAGDHVRGDAAVVRQVLPRAALPRLQGPAPAARVARGRCWRARAWSRSRR